MDESYEIYVHVYGVSEPILRNGCAVILRRTLNDIVNITSALCRVKTN